MHSQVHDMYTHIPLYTAFQRQHGQFSLLYIIMIILDLSISKLWHHGVYRHGVAVIIKSVLMRTDYVSNGNRGNRPVNLLV